MEHIPHGMKMAKRSQNITMSMTRSTANKPSGMRAARRKVSGALSMALSVARGLNTALKTRRMIDEEKIEKKA